MKNLLFVSLVFILACTNKKTTVFSPVPFSKSGIQFNNVVTESDSINSIDMEFLYNGGGVAIGDFNNDSLPDIYFTASQSSNKLYLNKGGLKFQDITQEAKVTGEGKWANAASVIDINNDGLLDIYVCNTIKKNGPQRANLLYVNQGVQKDGIPVFREMAAEYNLADTNMSVHAAFFDYDNDGDLDMYLVNTRLAQRNGVRFDKESHEKNNPMSDRLFRNDPSAALGHPVFTDVSLAAGISDDGYGLAVSIADVNQDGWKDIYVTNDFFTSDRLYINQRNGTFINKVGNAMKHTSQNAMGNDIADINNDGLPDVVAVDMNPRDNYRKKKNMTSNNYYSYQSMVQGSMMFQYVRNTLQLNNGIVKDTDGVSIPVFSDIGFYADVAETDWSWSSLFADFDNDGYKDLFITNGYPKDVTDHDFIFFYSNYSRLMAKKDLLDEIPKIKISNYAFRNSGNLRFENVSKKWGLDQLCFSAGAAYADLDNDGDLDYIINNINEEAFVYENNSEQLDRKNYLNIRFNGSEQNRNGIGATATIYIRDKRQDFENSPYRGYLSTMDCSLHFGIGSETSIDSLVIKWPSGNKRQTIIHPAINSTLIADIKQASEQNDSLQAPATLFADITRKSGITLRHLETDYIDFDAERLLPHKLSEYGPAIAAGDIDGNGLEDLFVGAALGTDANILFQQADGKFIQKSFAANTDLEDRKPEILGSLLFDADGDGDLDLYLASGSDEVPEDSKTYQDRLFLNNGKGNFKCDTSALPTNVTSKSCVKAVDFDNDGDLDLFVGGRLIPAKYPLPANSFIFRNDTKDGVVKFTDVTKQVAPSLQNIGLVCDALWTDYDNDGWPDLLLSGEWMPLTFLHNDKGVLKNTTDATGIQDKKGWWGGIAAGDFDNDGDIDYVAGNLGENSFYRADSLHPVHMYSGDLSNSGKFISIPSLYLPDGKGEKHEYPAHTRDDVTSQMPLLKKKFLTYKSFGDAKISDLFSPEILKKANVVTANYFTSVYIENKGKGKFVFHPLPALAQMAPINGIVAEDVDGDGLLDIILCGNDYGNEVTSGRLDGLNGLILKGNGNGGFTPINLEKTGFYVPGNAKALVKFRGPGNDYLLAASQNKSFLKLFTSKSPNAELISLQPGDKEVYYTLANGKVRKEEVYYGSSFLSQSSHFISIEPGMKSVEVVGKGGLRRKLK